MATYREVFADPTFRVLFWTRAVAQIADSLRVVALSVYVFAVTGSPLLGAVTFGIGFLPQIVGGMLLGALADRVRPRLLISVGYLVECVVGLVLALVPMPVPVAMGLVAAVAMITPVFSGASAKVVASVLTGDAYVLARSTFGLSNAASQLVGLAVGGLAIAWVGPLHALAITAGAHVFAAAVVRLRLADLPATGAAGQASLVLHSWRVNRTLLADSGVRTLLLANWLPAAFGTGADSLLVPYCGARGFSAVVAGLLLACVPVGMLVGQFAVGRLLAPAARERAVPLLVATIGLPMLGFAVAPPAAAIGVLLVVVGCGFAYGVGLQRQFVELVPDAVRGQAFALMSTGLMTVQGIGPAVFGGLAELVPTGTSMAVAGAVTVLTALVLRPRLAALTAPAPMAGSPA